MLPGCEHSMDLDNRSALGEHNHVQKCSRMKRGRLVRVSIVSHPPDMGPAAVLSSLLSEPFFVPTCFSAVLSFSRSHVHKTGLSKSHCLRYFSSMNETIATVLKDVNEKLSPWGEVAWHLDITYEEGKPAFLFGYTDTNDFFDLTIYDADNYTICEFRDDQWIENVDLSEST